MPLAVGQGRLDRSTGPESMGIHPESPQWYQCHHRLPGLGQLPCPDEKTGSGEENRPACTTAHGAWARCGKRSKRANGCRAILNGITLLPFHRS